MALLSAKALLFTTLLFTLTAQAANKDSYSLRAAYFKANTGESLEVLSHLQAGSAQAFNWQGTAIDAAYVYTQAALNFGLPNLAAKTLNAGNGDSASLAQVAYAEHQYSAGQYADAQRSLDAVAQSVSGLAQGRWQYLQGQLFIQAGAMEKAQLLYKKWRGKSPLRAYLALNIGIWLAENNDLSHAAQWLKTTVDLDLPPGEEWATLRDRAYVYLGSVYNWQGKPGLARRAYEKVRLDGVDANRALLGLGWTDVARAQNKEALAPWMYLSEQNQSDASVQESYLLVPFALARLNAYGKASNVLARAVRVYDQEMALLRTARVDAASGALLARISGAYLSGEENWLHTLRDALGTQLSVYIADALKNRQTAHLQNSYRQLLAMEKQLQSWSREQRSTAIAKRQAIQQRITTLKKLYSSQVSGELDDYFARQMKRIKGYQSHANFSLAGQR